MTAPQEVTVAISTYGPEGLARVALPPPTPGFRFAIFAQGCGDAGCAVLARTDAALHRLSGRGISNSRNAALDACETPLLLFADDDHDLDLDGIEALAGRAIADQGLAMAVGVRANRAHRRRFRRPHAVTPYNSGRLAAPEMLVRPSVVHASGVRFDPRFGVGTDLPLGEEFLFACDLVRAGQRVHAWPIVTGAHRGGPSSGDRWTDPRISRARSAVMTRAYGRAAPLARLVYAVRHGRRLGLADALRMAADRFH